MTQQRPPSNEVDNLDALQDEVLNICKDYSKLCNQLMNGFKTHTDDRVEVVMTLLLNRMLSHFDGILLLAEKQLLHQAEILSRSLIACSFDYIAYHRHPEFVTALVIGDDNERRQVLNNYYRQQLEKPTLTQLELEQLHVIIESADQIDRSDIHTCIKADMAGLLNDYRTTYQLLSESVHNSLHSLEQDLEIDELHDEIIGINCHGDGLNNLNNLIMIAETFLHNCLAIAIQQNGNNKADLDALNQHKHRLNSVWQTHTMKASHRQNHV